MPERTIVANARDDSYAIEPATHDLLRPGTGEADRLPGRDA